MWLTSRPQLPGTRPHLSQLPDLSPYTRPFFARQAGVRHPSAAKARRSSDPSNPPEDQAQQPQRRGRKPKTVSLDAAAEEDAPVPAEASSKRRGRRTKAEIEEADLAAEAYTASLTQEAAETSAALATRQPAPAEGPGSWAEAAATTAGEDDRRRFPYHRRIHTAAQDGNISGAETAFTSMAAAGLPPGPRAYHVLLCAYLKAGNVVGGLDVTRRATDAGVQLLPESYAALIFSYMELNPPDVAVAKTLYSAMAGTDADQQLPWSVLCRLLSSKGFAADTVAIVREGLAAGLEMDPDVAEAYIKALCETQQSDVALRLLEDVQAKYGFRPEARHVNYVVEAQALAGNLVDAAGLMEASGVRGWGRNAGTFNGYLMGLVRQLKEEENPNAADELVSSFSTLPSRMIQSGIRPDKITYKLEAEGFIELGDARNAMASITSVRNTAGSNGCRLLDSDSLAQLLQLLCDQDMPMDLLQLLVNMSEDGCRIPPGALAPDSTGRTLLSRWVVEHMEGIAARAEARELADSMLKSPIEVVDGYRIGPGRCVIDDAGLVVPVSKCTIKELRAEAKAREIEGAEDMKRPELLQAVKTARSRLPFNVLKAQVMGDASGTKKKKESSAAAKKKRRQRVYRDVWSIDPDRGEVDIAVAPKQVGEEDKFLLEGEALEQIDVFDDQYGVKTFKDMQGVNFEAVMEARMLDEGAAAIMNVGDEDVASGFATLLPGAGEGDDEEDEDEDESKGGEGRDWEQMSRDTELPGLQEGYQQLLMLQDKRLDTEEANLVAGMDVALDCVRAAEMLGGGCSAADVLVLQQAALAERSSSAAVAVAERLKMLLQAGAVDSDNQPVDQQRVSQLYEELAEMCLQTRSAQSADLVLEAAESAGLQPNEALIQRLGIALRGRPRRSARLQMENAGLLERAGLDISADDDLQQLQLQQQQQQDSSSSSVPAQLPSAAAAPPPVDVQATAVLEQPVEQQQGQQEETDSEDEVEDCGADEIDTGTLQVMQILTNIADMNAHRETIGPVLEKTGLSHDQVMDILNDPVALMSDTSWIPQALIQKPDPEDAEDADADDDSSSAAEQGEAGEGEENEGESMSLLALAHAAAEGSLTPEQNEWLLSEAERHQLPLMLDESTGQLIWPGTAEYEEWAAEDENGALAQEDFLALGAAFEEEFKDMIDKADQAAEEMMNMVENPDGSAKPLDQETEEGIDAMFAMFMDRMKNNGMLEVEEGEEGEEPTISINHDKMDNIDIDAELQRLTEEWGPIIEAKRQQLQDEGILDDLRDINFPVDELKLDTPRAGAGVSGLTADNA